MSGRFTVKKVSYFRPGDRVRVVERTRGYDRQCGVVVSLPSNPLLESVDMTRTELDQLRIYEVQLDGGETMNFTGLDLEPESDH